MWYIKFKERRIYLTPKEEFKFGRKSGNFLLPNDQSLSRLHASISIIPKNELKIGKPSSICVIKDLNSKYGSYVLHGDSQTQVSAEGYELKDGDKVQLGLQDSIITVVHVPIVMLTSSLNCEDKVNLGMLLSEYIDGVIINKWTKCCTHLTVKIPKLTEKVTLAMAAGIPIVTMEYWKDVRFAIEKGQPMPDTKNYTPQIGESLINKNDVSLAPNMQRKMLFTDRIFVFLCKQQYETYWQMIELAGGNAVVYSRESFTIKDLCGPKVIVLQYPFNDTLESTQKIVPDYDKISDALSASHRKLIPASEIPISLLYCCTKRFCNPTFRVEKLLKQRAVKSDKSKILAIDTQDSTPDIRILPNVISNIPVQVQVDHHKRPIQIIPETCDNFETQSNDSIQNQPNNKSEFLKSQNVDVKKTARKRKIEIIPETVESLPQEKEESSRNEKRLKVSCVDDVILVPDTNESSLKEGNTNAHIVRKEVICIPETNDLIQENTLESESLHSLKRKKLSSTGNPVCIPETIDSSSSNISSKSTQPQTHKKKNFTNEESSCSSELHDMLSQMPEIQLIPKKSTVNSVSKEKKDVATSRKNLTIEASNDRNKRKKDSQQMSIIPETPENLTNSDGNPMGTTASSNDSRSNNTEISIMKVTSNCMSKEKKGLNTLDKNLSEASNDRNKSKKGSRIQVIPETLENDSTNLMRTPSASSNDSSSSNEISIVKSIINNALEKKKDVETFDKNLTGEVSNNRSRDKIRRDLDIEIIPETPEKNVENSERNLLSTPVASIDNTRSNSVEIPLTEWQGPLNKEVENRNTSTEECSNWIVTNNTASPNERIPLRSNSITRLNCNSLSLRKPIGKIFKKAYCKKPHPYLDFTGGNKHLWKTHNTD